MTAAGPARALRLKRVFDVAATAAGLVPLAPVLALLALVVRATAGPGPVLLRQPRLGHRGRPFVLYKFRTMTEERGAAGVLLPDEVRLTRAGRWLRALSLDELPELLNVLRGEMSLVGPRPLLVDYRELYRPEQWRRHEMPPGITGLVQVSGRNALDWDEKFALDVWYVDHWSFWLDLKILARTAWKVLRADGISAPGHATMPAFGQPPEGRPAARGVDARPNA